jgi:membrane protein YdbS with pleckstrin-like domain
MASDERVLFRTGYHPAVFSGSVTLALTVAGIVALIVRRNDLPTPVVLQLWLAGTVVVLVGALPAAWRWWTSEFVVTGERVAVRTGPLVRGALDVPLARLEAIEVEQGWLGRRFGFGTLGIVGTDGSSRAYVRVAHPEALREAVLRAAPPVVRRRSGG